jgi:hypothetical protein
MGGGIDGADGQPGAILLGRKAGDDTGGEGGEQRDRHLAPQAV